VGEVAHEIPLLSMILLLPVAGALAVLPLGRHPLAAKVVYMAFTLTSLAFAVVLLMGFLPRDGPLLDLGGDPYSPGRFRAFEEYPWVPQVQVFYRLGVDELSFSLVFLTALLFPLAGLVHWNDGYRVRDFLVMFLLLETTILGVFMALDFILFFVFWELQLAPMYFIIAIWGGPRRRYAALKFFLFTQAASLLVFLGIFAFFAYQGGLASPDAFNMVVFTLRSPIPVPLQDLLFIAFLIGFGTKLPMVPLHTWLLDAHVEAPTGGSVILAGVLLKMGGYGLVRVNFQMLAEAAVNLWWLLVVLGVVSVLYGAFISLAQDDLKRLVAASSISHMGLVLLGVGAAAHAFATQTVGPTLVQGAAPPAGVPGSFALSGAVFEMFAHGLISAALFIAAGALGHVLGTRDISKLGGLLNSMPRLGGFTMIAFLASLGLPGLVGFAAEFMVFAGTYEAVGIWVLVPISMVVWTAAYYIWAFQRAFHGPPIETAGHPHDIHANDVVPLAVLTALAVLFGVAPFLFTDFIVDWAAEVALPSLGGP
jgi:NADH-quinone oxidoreductase subunit M